MHRWRCHDAPIRITITLDPDIEELVRLEMHERRVSFEQAVDDGLRSGLRDLSPAESFETPRFDLGTPRASLDRALALAGALEDEERLQRLTVGR